MNKTAIYISIIIFLLVTNVATIITTLSVSKGEKEEIEPAVIELPRENRMGYFHNQIGIRDDQLPRFRDFNREYNMKAGELTLRMRTLRREMVDEMASEDPDTVLLDNIASEFGDMHKRMKLLTMEYYFNLKSISDADQKERLHFVFRDMLDQEGNIYGRGRGGRGYGYGRGGGRLQYENYYY